MSRKKRHIPEQARSSVSSPASGRLAAVLDRRTTWVAIALVTLASARIVSTYTVFNHTIDEPAHIACGMEWLDQGVYRYEHQHPPLARVAAALGPYLDGTRSWKKPSMWNEGAGLLYGRKSYDRTLALARLGILPFFWIACAVVYLWARRHSGKMEALLALALFSFLPPVLAHAGLATTDMALTAFLSAAFLLLTMWLEQPDWRRSALFGLALGLAVLSKFSVLAFFPACVLTIAALAWWTKRPPLGAAPRALLRLLPGAALALLAAGLVIWAGYRFSFGTVHFANVKLPAPELYSGIRSVMEHNRDGNPTYLLGEYGKTGWWYYYLVVLAVKTPLPFLALAIAGAAICFQRRREQGWRDLAPLAMVVGIVAFASLFSRINIGVRHVLPVYVAASVLAAVAARRLFDTRPSSAWPRLLLGAALVWHAGTSALSHPDYIPYFNALAGTEPEKIVVDSDLDWGQDMKRLSARLRELSAREVAFNPFILAHYEAVHGFPKIQPLDPFEPQPGWNAVSLTILKLARMGLFEKHLDKPLWPDRVKPLERVGKGVLLYHFPPGR